MSQSLSAPGLVWEIDVGGWQGTGPTPPNIPKKGVLRGKKKKAPKTGKCATGQSNGDRVGSGKSLSGSALPDISTDDMPSGDLREHDEDESVFGDDMAIDYVPPKNHATVDLISQRKFIDLKKWYCISRPQYSKSCGISSLVSCWNYLFSKLGAGSLKPITQEEALTVLDFKPPFGQIKFGPFTGNQTLMRWFKQLNDHYGVRGRGYFLYKPIGKNRTSGLRGVQAVTKLKECLRKDDTAIIYHCLNHYFCPIGYEEVPRKAWDAYSCETVPEKDLTTWILVGDPSKKHPGMHCIKWDDIEQDLNLEMPEFLNVRQLHKGIQKRNTAKKSGNMHCLMAFQRSMWQGRKNSLQKGIKKTKCTQRDKIAKTVFKSKSAGRRQDLLKSDTDSDLHLPPIGGANSMLSDEMDELMHWVETGALTDYRPTHELVDEGNASQSGTSSCGQDEQDDFPKVEGHKVPERLEFDDVPNGQECVKSVMNLSIGGANVCHHEEDSTTGHGAENDMETESDCMSGEDL
ncbi:uncharacterized protein LOC135494649 isoform X1 [Lineus longissimus]|uniref:uncharacterized protein LOC135494649 isoform X1 n=1 Tax=Lineus longissimus TaxID=88925 RepID=UPI002B4CB312